MSLPRSERRHTDVPVGGSALRRWLWLPSVFVVTSAFYLINNGGAPHPDELYHVLAARSLLASGTPAIAEGVYERVYLHTWLIAQLFRWFGESLSIARVPSAIAMAGTVTVLFAWLRQVAGLRAAVFGAGLFAVSPFAVDIAQFARFYGLQTVTFVGGSLLAYGAVENPARGRWPRAMLAVGLLALATYLQMTSLIGVAALLVWLALRIGGAWLTAAPEKARARGLLVALTLLALAASSIVLYRAGALQSIWELYRHTAEFNQGNADNVLFYALWYTLYYPTLWPPIALLVVVAIAWCPKPAFFAAVVFVVVLVLSSFAGSKSLRYIVYVQPYAFVLFGLALASVWTPLARFLSDLRQRFAARLPFAETTARRLANATLILSLVVLILGNSATIRTVSLLADIEIPPEEKSVRWEAAGPALRSVMARSDVVVTMAELEMLYYFDRYDILLSSSRLGEIPDGVDFSPDFRTGRPVIGSTEAMREVLECYDSGVLVTNARRWGSSRFLPKELVSLIERSTQTVPLPKASRVLAFAWRHDDGSSPRPASCDRLPSFAR